VQTTKSYTISKQTVLEAYKRVRAKRGCAGVDEEMISDFESNLKDNLYKIWNRMSSGSYFPPAVKVVEIPKSNGKTRSLGIPTVSDRIAQMVAKMYLEPKVDRVFHEDSYGYRPNKSAIEALGVTRKRCWEYDWVLDADIKGFFDNIDHELMMRAVRKHTSCKWVLLYIERWLKSPAINVEGTQVKRDKGTPQGGVISPLLANLFLHYAFDEWMKRNYPNNPFERYADDIVVHCSTESGSESLKKAVEPRLKHCRLELNLEKTKIIYCKDDRRRGEYPLRKFDFLGYTFRSRRVKSGKGEYFVGFNPAVSNDAKKLLRKKVKHLVIQYRNKAKLEDLSEIINPVLRGWVNYFGKYRRTEILFTLYGVNETLVWWARKKYKRLKASHGRAYRWVGRIAKQEPSLFVHWSMGCGPVIE